MGTSYRMAQDGPHHSPTLPVGAGTLPPDLDAGMVFSLLIASVRTAAATVFDREGTILWCCPRCAEFFGCASPSDAVGRTLLRLTPSAWALERVDMIRRVAESGQPLTAFGIMVGQRTVTRYMKLPGTVAARVLAVSERCTGEEMRDIAARGTERVEFARVNDLGVLDALTARELEVLALLGEGLRPKEIADRIGRSVSTVDGHRERIGQKLGVHDRAELLVVARRAGLRVEDAGASRVRFFLESHAGRA